MKLAIFADAHHRGQDGGGSMTLDDLQLCFDAHNHLDMPPPERRVFPEESRCDFCDGLGREPNHKSCRACGGDGWIPVWPPGTPVAQDEFFFQPQA